jgi:hypothetical protein
MAFDPTSPNYPSQSGEDAMNAILENFLQLRKSEEGSVAPSNAVKGMFWQDTGNSLMKQRNQANNAWITLWELDSHYPSFPSGTKMVFFQASAPTGWTKDTTYNGYMLHIVTDGTGGTTGGSDNPIGAHIHTGGSYALSVANLPPHIHSINKAPAGIGSGGPGSPSTGVSANSGSTGSGTAHSHGATSANFSPKYYNGIVCSKD